ncbi:tRNA guanosine(34) transglycosylase Tgt [Candidatus Berkelbacteria bacterium]|nr:tRNA guanosine(34) transglycosylase Tgt [Candidatus Berkelbacteria bacterium]
MRMQPFTVLATEGQARRGRITTAHGTIETPAFVPCATHGSIRGVPTDRLRPRRSLRPRSGPASASGESDITPGEIPRLELILSNIYHLMLRPGIEAIEALGGIHRFMGWERAIITDSGGFQAFVFAERTSSRSSKNEGGPAQLRQGFAGQPSLRMSEEGMTFRSHLDGSTHLLTPESVIEMQERIGVDIGTCLDVCTGFPVPEREVAQAVDQTNRWAERSIGHWSSVTGQLLLYGMVQGSIYEDQRRRSAEFIRALPFAGFAIGGNMYTFGATLAELAAQKPRMWEVVGYTASLLPEDKPRHLLGVGEPSDLIAGVKQGIDTFDCVMATRIARHGSAWVRTEPEGWAYRRENLRSAEFSRSTAPIDARCACLACRRRVPRGYLRHLLVEQDPVAAELLTLHNLTFLATLMAEIRSSLEVGTFTDRFGG